MLLETCNSGFEFTGLNTCPDGTTCQQFWQIFNNNAAIFCGQIWDYSYTVVPDSQPCMKIWFNGSNPNDAVASYYAKQNGAEIETFNVFLLLFASIIKISIF